MTYPMNRQALAQKQIEDGEQHFEARRLDRALVSFETAAALCPDMAEAYYQLARTHVLLKDPASGQAAARAGLKVDPRHAGCAHILGLILSEGDNLDEGLVWLKVAVEGAPNHPQVQRDLGVVMLFLGDIEGAREHLMAALKLDVQAHEVLFNLVRITDMSADTDDVQVLMTGMHRLAGVTDTLSPQLAVQVFYSLANAYEARGQADEAFAWLQRGANAQRASRTYDAPADLNRVRRTGEVFNSNHLSRLSGAGLETNRPIFIVGMPRSGTTLVEQIVSAHPEVYGAGEHPTLLHLLMNSTGLEGARWPDWGSAMLPIDCKNLGQRYLDNIPPVPGAESRTTDKRLENFEFLGLVHLTLPKAPIIHVRRDPRDMALSCYAMLFSNGQEWSYDMAELAAYWREHERLMEHWKTVLPPGRILEVSYEDLVTDLEPQARRIIAHCGLTWDDACLQFHRSVRPVRSASAAQVREPIYDRSIGRWKAFGGHMKPLYDAMGLQIPST